MLGRIRAGIQYMLKPVLWIVILSFVAAIFVVYGVQYTGSSFLTPGVLASIGNEQIMVDDYQRAFQRQYDFYRQLMGKNFDEKVLERMNLRDQVLESLIRRSLVVQAARRLGFEVTSGELAEEIRSYPAFNGPGGFTRARYLLVLQQNRLRPEQFEEQLRRDLLYRKVEDAIKGAVQVTQGEAEEAYREEKQKLTVEYVVLQPPDTAKGKAEKILGFLGQGKSFKDAVIGAGFEPKSVGPFGTDDPLKDIPDAATFRRGALELRKGETSPLVQGQNAAFLLHLLDRQEPDMAAFEKDQAIIRQQLLSQKREMVFNEWVRSLRRTAKIKVNREILGG